MGFFYKCLSNRVSNKYYFNTVCFLMDKNKFCRLQYFSSAFNSTLSYPTCKPLKLLNNNKVDVPANNRNFSLSLSYDLKAKLKKIVRKLLLLEQMKDSNLALKWYTTLRKQNYEEFFTLLEMPDTFYSWCQVLQLHVWMLLVRLQQESDCSQRVRLALINFMWEEIQLRAKTHAPMNKEFRKNMTHIYEEFRTKLFSFDEAFLIDDRALASSLWCHFFNKNCDDPRKLEALVSFIRCQIDQLQLINNKDIEDVNSTKTVWKSFGDHVKYKMQ